MNIESDNTVKMTQEDIDVQITELKATLEKIIKQISRNIRTLKTKRNTLAAVSRLPAELLSRIFHLARDDANGKYSWIYATLTCRAWRLCALSCATLWTNIDCMKIMWAQEMLSRSRDAPLNIVATKGSHWLSPIPGIDNIRMVLDLAPRASALTMTSCHLLKMRGDPQIMWPATSPLLETLTIHAIALAQGNHPLPDLFIHGVFPKLRRVHLQHCTFSWQGTSFFRSLSDLEVVYSRGSEYPLPPVSKILDTLQSMVLLERLNLSFDPPIDLDHPDNVPSSPAGSALAKVDLPRLAVLKLALDIPVILSLLNHISQPSERLYLSGTLRSEDAARALVRCLKRFCVSQVQDWGRSMDSARLWDCGTLNWSIEICDPARVEAFCPLRAQFSVHEALEERVLDILCAGLPFTALRAIMFNAPAAFLAARPHLAQCTTLCASGAQIDSARLFHQPAMFWRDDHSRWLPKLQTIVAHDMDIRHLAGIERKPGSTSATFVEFCQRLPPLKRIKFFECQAYTQDWLDELRKSLPHIGVEATRWRQDYVPLFKSSAAAMKGMLR